MQIGFMDQVNYLGNGCYYNLINAAESAMGLLGGVKVYQVDPDGEVNPSSTETSPSIWNESFHVIIVKCALFALFFIPAVVIKCFTRPCVSFYSPQPWISKEEFVTESNSCGDILERLGKVTHLFKAHRGSVTPQSYFIELRARDTLNSFITRHNLSHLFDDSRTNTSQEDTANLRGQDLYDYIRSACSYDLTGYGCYTGLQNSA